jgi:hypothetical protein
MQEIFKVEAIELDDLKVEVQDAINSSFIQKTTSKTIKHWENQFSINLEGIETLEEKQQEILSKMLGFTKLSGSKIQDIVLTKTGYKSTVTVENSDIVITYDDIGYPDAEGQAYIKDYLHNLAPAHLGFKIVFIFRKHGTINEHTHNYLNVYTHKLIRTKKEDL